jgi:tetratricopeptide (TPR) repeat protein
MFRPFALLCFSSLLLACATSTPVAPNLPPTAAPEPEVSVEQPAPPERAIPDDSLYPLLVAEFALRRRAYDVALENYLEQAHKLDDPGLRSHATHLAQFMRQDEAALEAVQLWVQTEPDNIEANTTLANLLARQGRSPEALPHLATVSRGGAKAQYPILLTGFQKLDNQQQQDLLNGVNTLALEFPDDIQLLLAQALIYEEIGQNDAAMKNITRIFELEPYQNQAVLLEAKVLVEKGAKNPFARMEKALEIHPDDKRLRMQYARLLTRTDLEAARQQFEMMSAEDPRDGDLLFSLALINRETGDYLTAKAYLRQLLDLGQRPDEANYYLGRIAEEQEEPQKALYHYRQVASGGDFFSANNRIGQIMLGEDQTEELQLYFETLRNQYPEKKLQLYALETDLLAKANETVLAMTVLNQALDNFPNSTALRYTRSMLGERQDNLVLMESDLRSIIAQEPNNATALNALGYSLANRTERFAEAHDLIARALEIDPEEPAILDSMGWVLYRQGNYEEALSYLSRAYVMFPDPEVAAHLGEVMWATGDTEGAKDIWRAALMKAPEHDILVATLKRLGVPDLQGPVTEAPR